jgi:hypothetical protein
MGGHRVSIYMPVHRTGREIEQDPLRLRNLLDEAAGELEAAGVRTPEIAALLQPARDLITDPPFWSHQNAGLALFIKPEQMCTFELPFAVPELAVAGGRFHLRPLVAGLGPDQPYYVLALNRRNPRLLRGDRLGLKALDLTGAPEGLDDVLALIESKERQVQIRTGARTGDRSNVVFHGHGGAPDDDQDRLLEYFRELDAGVMHVLHDKRLPLVLAGLPYLLPLYRAATQYGHVMERALEINAEPLDERQLHARTWELVRPLAAAKAHSERARYEAAEAQGTAAHGVVAVLPAAVQGRIAALFVADREYRWGTVDSTTGEAVVHEERAPGDEELVDRAIAETLARGGQVYALAAERMPHGAGLAALLRY